MNKENIQKPEKEIGKEAAKEVYEKPMVIEYDSPTVSFTTMWDKSTS